MNNKYVYTISGFLISTILLAEQSDGAITFWISETSDSSVLVQASGSIDLSATLGYEFTTNSANFQAILHPSKGIISAGFGPSDVYEVDALYWSSFGSWSGSLGAITSIGEKFGLFDSRTDSQVRLSLPSGYVSDSFISSSAEFSGSFSSLGLNQGSFITTFSNGGSSDHIVVNVVPEPSSYLLLASGMLLAFCIRKRN